VIWSRIWQLFYIIDHLIDTTCRVQHLGCFLEGQGHSMTFQHNCVWPITLWFEVEFYNYFTGMINILRQRVVCYLEGQGHSMTLQQNGVWPKTLLFEVGFHNFFWQTTSLCPIPFREHYPVPTGSCFPFNLTYVFHSIALLILFIISQCLMLNLLIIPLCQHYLLEFY